MATKKSTRTKAGNSPKKQRKLTKPKEIVQKSSKKAKVSRKRKPTAHKVDAGVFLEQLNSLVNGNNLEEALEFLDSTTGLKNGKIYIFAP